MINDIQAAEQIKKNRQSKEIIEGLGDVKNLVVQKCRPLLIIEQSEFSLPALKIMDVYLSRINSRDSKKRTVIINPGELEHALGVDRIRRDELRDWLKELLSPVARPLGYKRGEIYINLFELAHFVEDEDGLWKICLECTTTAKDYFFNVEKLGYFKYKLHCITSIKSPHSYRLFLLLQNSKNRYMEECKDEPVISFSYDLTALKKYLGCKENSWSSFREFNRDVLKKGKEELKKCCNFDFDYEPDGKGRRPTKSVKFILPKDVITIDDKAATIKSTSNVSTNPLICEYFNVLSQFNPSVLDQEEIKSLLDVILDEHLPLAAFDNSRDLALRQYLDQKVKKMKNQKGSIENPCKYLCSMIRNDISTNLLDKPTKNTKNAFTNFNQRQYDYDKIEKLMLAKQKKDVVNIKDYTNF